MRVAVITLVAGRHRHLALQQRGLAASDLAPDHYVVITLDDPGAADVLQNQLPAPDVLPLSWEGRQLPLAAARNAGARRALDNNADLLVFLDVDCVPGSTLLSRYAQTARHGALLCGTVAYLPPPPPEGYRLGALPDLASPHPGRPIPADDEVLTGGEHNLFWSLSFAVTASTWRLIGGFCERYAGYGGEDTDFVRVAESRDVDLWWVGGAPPTTSTTRLSRPLVELLDDILRNGAVYRERWGSWPMTGWLHEFARLGLLHHDPVTDDWTRCAPWARARNGGK